MTRPAQSTQPPPNTTKPFDKQPPSKYPYGPKDKKYFPPQPNGLRAFAT